LIKRNWFHDAIKAYFFIIKNHCCILCNPESKKLVWCRYWKHSFMSLPLQCYIIVAISRLCQNKRSSSNLYTRHIIHITNPNPAREIIFFYDIIVLFSVSYILLVIEISYRSYRNSQNELEWHQYQLTWICNFEIEKIHQSFTTLDEDH